MMMYGVDWWLITDILGQLVVPICKGGKKSIFVGLFDL
jgi:hypothetical protein